MTMTAVYIQKTYVNKSFAWTDEANPVDSVHLIAEFYECECNIFHAIHHEK